MGLLLMGTTGHTADQLLKLMCLKKKHLHLISQAFSEFLDPLRSCEMFHIANKIYLNQQFHVTQEFQGIATNVFLSDTETIDFSQHIALNSINEWVEENTEHSVHNLLTPESLEDADILVVNAIRFHGMWKFPFSSDRTSIGLFYVTQTASIEVNMMHGTVSGDLK